MKTSKAAVARAVDQPDPTVRFYLFYGPDEAQSRGLAERLQSALGAARSVIAGTACAGGAWVNGLDRGMCATTGCAKPQADHGPAGARRGLKLDRG